jgi:CDP-diacylglycerol--glycerol-3-phosphate 3-phosphatidyltransferase
VVGGSRRYDGPLGKSDRAFLFGLLGAWAGSGLPLPQWVGWSMPVAAVLLVVTVVRRVRGGLGAARDAEGDTAARRKEVR